MSEEGYDHSKSEIAELGQKLVVLGIAMKDPDTRLADLAALAHDAGMRVSFDFDAAS